MALSHYDLMRIEVLADCATDPKRDLYQRLTDQEREVLMLAVSEARLLNNY